MPERRGGPVGVGNGPDRVNLMDAAAVVVGYALASLLVRAYWPENNRPSFWEVLVIGLVFGWLGLAMSGPVVLMIRRPAPVSPGDDDRPEPCTWAELAWMIIGIYWIGLAMLVVPLRMNGSRLMDSAALGVFPVLAALVLRVVGPRQRWARARPRGDEPAWTHRAGIGLLVTWPFAWVGLMILGKSLFSN